eukprot:sb/3469082/
MGCLSDFIAGAIRVILFGLNFATLMTGAVLLGCGVYIKIAMNQFTDMEDVKGLDVVAVQGALCSSVSSFGCPKSELIPPNLVYGKGDTTSDATIDHIQGLLECCGYNGPTDYGIITQIDLPKSCCSDVVPGGACNTLTAYKTGCKAQIEHFISSQTTIVIITVCAVVVLEIVTMLAACYLRRKELKDIYLVNTPPYSIYNITSTGEPGTICLAPPTLSDQMGVWRRHTGNYNGVQAPDD